MVLWTYLTYCKDLVHPKLKQLEQWKIIWFHLTGNNVPTKVIETPSFVTMWSIFSRKITQGGVEPPSPYRRVMLCIYGVYLLYTTTVTSSFSSSTGVVVLVRTYRFCSGTSCFTSTMLWYMGTPHIPCTTNKYKYLSLPILVQLVPLIGFLPCRGVLY